MLYLDGMGPRQSMAVEILDTVRFGGLDKIKGANGYSKKRLDKGDAYVVPFGLSKKIIWCSRNFCSEKAIYYIQDKWCRRDCAIEVYMGSEAILSE